MKEKILKLHKIILLMHTMETLRQSKNLLLFFFLFLREPAMTPCSEVISVYKI